MPTFLVSTIPSFTLKVNMSSPWKCKLGLYVTLAEVELIGEIALRVPNAGPLATENFKGVEDSLYKRSVSLAFNLIVIGLLLLL